MNETEKHGVWTYNESADYTAQNAGLPDMLITHGQTLQSAEHTAAQLAERYPADTFEVRDYKSDVIVTLGTERPDLAEVTRARHAARRMRRPLGTRGV